MTTTASQVIKTLFNIGYSFMTSFYLPGLNVTPLVITMTALFVVVTWKMLKKMLGMGNDNK